MLLNKIKYLLNTTPAQRAADRAEYNALNCQCDKLYHARELAYDEICTCAQPDADLWNVLACVKQQRVDFYERASFWHQEECEHFSFLRPCKNGKCPKVLANHLYISRNNDYERALNKLNDFWSEKYKRVK